MSLSRLELEGVVRAMLRDLDEARLKERRQDNLFLTEVEACLREYINVHGACLWCGQVVAEAKMLHADDCRFGHLRPSKQNATQT